MKQSSQKIELALLSTVFTTVVGIFVGLLILPH